MAGELGEIASDAMDEARADFDATVAQRQDWSGNAVPALRRSEIADRPRGFLSRKKGFD
jgi:hypothetical protein